MKVIRVLIYEGSEAWIEKTNNRNSVVGVRNVPGGKITSFFLGTLPDEIDMFVKNIKEESSGA